MKKMNISIWLPGGILATVALFSLFGPFLTPYDFSTSSLMERNLPPVFLGGDWAHPLGTDKLGRDLLARLAMGCRVSIGLALIGTLLGAIFGSALGFLAARGNKIIDTLITTAVDFQAAIPFMIIAMAVLAVAGSSMILFVILLGFYGWEAYARLVRNSAISAHSLPFVESAKVMGVNAVDIDRRHILPTVANIIIVQATLNFPQTILLESGLSFLGLGIQPPSTSLGQLIGGGRDSLARAWWIAVFPGIIIFVTTLSITLLGDQLRDRLDPVTERR